MLYKTFFLITPTTCKYIVGGVVGRQAGREEAQGAWLRRSSSKKMLTSTTHAFFKVQLGRVPWEFGTSKILRSLPCTYP